MFGLFTSRAIPGLALAAVAAWAPPVAAEGQRALLELEQQVQDSHPRVRHLLPHQLMDMIRQDRKLLLLDVRDRAEFEVSHIPGAVLVDPALSAREFRKRFGAELAGRTVLLYCSVGVRSSRLAQRIEEVARAGGAAGVYNLRGGIFAWHNYGKRLVEQHSRAADVVHPYSASWSHYLDFPEHTSYGRR